MKKQFYDGTKLISLKDLDGNEPEIYMCVGNRTAGKSYYFKRLLVRKFQKKKEKFCLLVRFSYELDGIAENFFKDLQQIDFPASTMTDKKIAKGLFVELELDGEPCGYAIALNNADALKKYSSRFVDVDNMFFDEFQSETGKYAPEEIKKFQSIHVSIARGDGEHIRRVPVYMASNTVSTLNPYFAAFGIQKRLTPNTKYLRGKGWVLEQCYVDTAAKALKESGFGRAFQNDAYMNYATDNSYLLDSDAFIEKINGEGRLVCNLTADDVTVGIWEMEKAGVVYCSTKFDPGFPLNFIYKTKDHGVNFIMLKKSSVQAKYMKRMFELGAMRFENLTIKNLVLDFLGLSVL